jgi:hypothetical protein
MFVRTFWESDLVLGLDVCPPQKPTGKDEVLVLGGVVGVEVVARLEAGFLAFGVF